MSDNSSFMRSAQLSAASVDAGLRSHMLRIYNRMALGVFVTAVVAWFVHDAQLTSFFMAGPQKFLVIFAPLAITMFGFNPARMSSKALGISFLAVAVSYGLCFSTLLAIYNGESIAKAFFIASSMFLGVSIFGYTTKRDLSPMRTFLFMGMIGLIVLSLVNMGLSMFVADYGFGSMMSNLLSVVSIVLFAGMTAWQTQDMKEIYSPYADNEATSRLSWVAALNLYISFIAMFQSILHLLGNRE
ncbi:MAG: Bax inhibitor-1/YccA family protein [Pseudobdellovibrionaceae bacterium]|nr:Bax inhibitor-1/YccA family protein [Pseudobdellovibrionaceae bacterium]